MRRKVREFLIQKLWDNYTHHVPFYHKLFSNQKLALDHFAIIDLPSQNSGIKPLSDVLSKIGYIYRGEGYLAEKQNPFQWLREENYQSQLPQDILPQIVVADFKLTELSPKVRAIIEKYSNFSKPIDQSKLKFYEEQIDNGNHLFVSHYVEFLYQHIVSREWPLPTVEEYETVNKENELISWVLAFGRRVNHFGVSIHLMNKYANLEEFNNHVLETAAVALNSNPKTIKGGEYCGIAQSSSEGLPIKIQLKNGEITVPNSFMEFVWRYPLKENPKFWVDYYSDFIPQNANFVIESLYTNK